MNFTITVAVVAREETLDAMNYYENIRMGLGDDFLEDLEERYSAISKNPYLFGYADKLLILRDTSLNRFPFLVIYKIQFNSLIILSVHNTYKKPPSFL